MVADILPVDPDLGIVVTGTDVQKCTLACPGRGEGDGLAIPNALAKILIANAGQLTFTAEGDGNGLGEGGTVLVAALLARKAAIGLIVPRAVQIDPVRLAAIKLGAGKFGTGHGGDVIHNKITSFHVNSDTSCIVDNYNRHREICQEKMPFFFRTLYLKFAGRTGGGS